MLEPAFIKAECQFEFFGNLMTCCLGEEELKVIQKDRPG